MHQHAGQASHGSRAGKLNAAYVVAGRFVARMAQTNPSAKSFKIDTARGLSFDDGGVKTPLSLFHIVNFAEKLRGTKQVDRFDISGSAVTLHFNDFGLEGLRKFAIAQKPVVPRKTSKTLMRTRLLDAFKAFEQKTAADARPVPAPAVPKQPSQQQATAASLLGPILQTLVHGPRSAEEVARLVSIRARIPMHKRGEAWLENGTTFDEAVRHAVNYLIGRRLLAHPTRQIGLTSDGRQCAESFETFAAEGFAEPDAPQRAAPKTRVGAIRVMSEKDMLEFMESLPAKSPRDILAIWRNAVGITADETREQHHLQARVMIRAIEKEWDDRMARADLADSFRWPDATVRRASASEDGDRSWSFDVMVDDGMLKEMGYRVGRNGLPTSVRQRMLSEIYARTLPPVFPKPYMDQWGANASARRLHKIADCLAAFARNAARLPGNYDEAISDWHEDLEYMHDTHYAGRYGFGWPKSADASAAALRR